MKITNLEVGIQIETEKAIGFFGNREVSFEGLTVSFPNYEFRKLKQTHSDRVVNSSQEVYDADAHFTQERNVGLVIQSADCAPILIFDEAGGMVAAIHAGWRGVKNQIAINTLEALKGKGLKKNSLHVFIGPHIQRQSFEVDEDVYLQLKDATPAVFTEEWSLISNYNPSTKKYHIDLNRQIQLQLLANDIEEENIHVLYYDTVTELKWHSHRRDRELAGRNLSFVALK